MLRNTAGMRMVLVAGAMAVPFLAGANWPQFRGPGGLGLAEGKGLPAKWSATENLAWKVELPGPGGSSPIVYADKIFLSCYTGYGLDQKSPGEMNDLKRHALCLNRADGKVIWQKEVETNLPEQAFGGYMALHGYSSSTPITDGERVYFFFGKSGVAAYTLDGEKVWQTSVGTGTHGWGSATSPVLYKDLIIVNASVECGQLVALDKKTGKETWKAGGMDSSWNSPLLVDLKGGKQELVISVRGNILGFDPATGKEIWRAKGIADYVCPSVIAHDGVVYAIGGRGNTAVAIRAGGQGDVTETNVVWRAGKGSNVSSPVYVDGHIYFASESKGMAYCLNAEDGKVVYDERLNPNPDRIYASPVAVDGKLYYVSRNKGVYVVAAKPTFELIAHNPPLDDSVFNGSPVVSKGQLLLRSNKYLYCLGSK